MMRSRVIGSNRHAGDHGTRDSFQAFHNVRPFDNLTLGLLLAAR